MTERDTRHTQHIHSHGEHSRLVRQPAGGGAPDTTKTGGVPRQTRHGLGKDARGQDQPTDKSRAQHDSGQQAQRDAAEQPPSPGLPAGGE
jgi:hypothetical protein